MEERRFKVLFDNMVVANNMDLKTATILVKALFDEYYNDCNMMVSVKEENRTVCEEEDEDYENKKAKYER